MGGPDANTDQGKKLISAARVSGDFPGSVAKRGDQTSLICSGSATMSMPWSARSVAPKTEGIHPQLHYRYYKNLPLSILCQSFAVSSSNGVDMYVVPCPISNQSQTFQFPALEGEEGQQRHGLKVWRLMSVSEAWLPLILKTEMYGELLFNIAWYCQPHRMGHGQHPNLKMDMDGWMDGWMDGGIKILSFISHFEKNVQ